MSKQTNSIQIILSAVEKGVTATFKRATGALTAFNKNAHNGIRIMGALEGAVGGVAGAFLGFSVVSGAVRMLQDAGQAAYNLEASLKAASREFGNVGGQRQWEQTIDRLSGKLRVYSKTDLQLAVSRTVDMTKRLGLSAEQMERVIELTGDLSAGKTTLEGGIERVTAALRGEAEASEYLGLTLNETYVKSWYEAKGAMQGAWKDLTDLEKAQIRYNVFLEQAIPMQGRAAASTKTFAGALAYARKEINDAVTENKDVASAMSGLADTIKDNAGEIGNLVSAIITWAARTTELIVTHRELAGQILKVVAGLYAVGKVSQILGVLLNMVRGLNAAFTFLTGQGFIAWAGGVVRAINAVKLSALGLKGALGAAAGALLAWEAGTSFGSWLYKSTEQAERDLARLRKEIEVTAAKYRQFAGFVPESKEGLFAKSTRELEEYKRQLESAYRHQAAVTNALYIAAKDKNIWGQQTEAARQAEIEYAAARTELERIEQAMDEFGAVSDQAHSKAAAAARGAAEASKQATGEALEAMKRKYLEYASEVRRLQDEITGRERSLAAELREMGRSGMDGYSAWQDRKREAEEYAAAARRAAQEAQQAMAAGDEVTGKAKFEEALQYADEAKQAYKDLNTEVKQGDQVVVSQADALKTAMNGVKEAGELGIDILKRQQDAAKQAKDALVEKSGFADLADGMDAAEKKWLENWQKMQAAAEKNVDAVEQRIVKMVNKDRTVYIDVVERQKRALGGLIGAARLATGGRLAGFGGGDRIPALLEAGEYVIRKEAVARFGSGLFDALNSLRLPDLSPMAAGAGGRMTLELKLPGGDAVSATVSGDDAERLKRWNRRVSHLGARR